ncbi:MAG TPA: hypothetical protein VIT42_06215 [Microlunatus sp.]
MATFVLVHGAWGGGWIWKKVIPILRAVGHEVYATTATAWVTVSTSPAQRLIWTLTLATSSTFWSSRS